MTRHPRRAHRRAALVAAAGLLLATPPGALATRATLTGSATPDHGPPGTPLSVKMGFTLDPENGQSSVVRRIELRLPHGGVINSRLFPTCSAEIINARRSFAGCPKGSLIGRGTGTGDVREVDTFGVPVTFTMFNGPGGTITTHVYAENPALISQAITARLTRTSGRYGYVVDIPVPYELQEINDGWFVEVRSFNATLGATTRDKSGRRRGWIELTTGCPRSLRLPIAGTFEFMRESAPVTVGSELTCRR